MKSFIDPANPLSINHRFRKKRFAFFLQFIEQHISHQEPFSILDIGGTQQYWVSMDFFRVFPNATITLVNLEKEAIQHPQLISTVGNACDLAQFKDHSFDIVFSNSVIEHLFTFSNQEKMAKEVNRIGKSHFIQTPNYWFPLEPHWMFPFFQFLPKSWRVALTKTFRLGHYPKADNQQQAIERVNEVRLLTRKELQQLFPKSNTYKEYFLGLVKSITMFH